MQPVVLRTERLALSMPTPEDVPLVYEHCQDPLIGEYTTVPQPYSESDAATFIGRMVPEAWEKGTERTWAIRLGPAAALLGVVSLWARPDGRFEIGYWLGAPHRGNGYMPEAVAAVLSWAEEALRPEAFVWQAAEGNLSSAIVARKVGFAFLGTRPTGANHPAYAARHPVSWHGERRADASAPADALPWPEGVEA